jgi:hypothetical protein
MATISHARGKRARRLALTTVATAALTALSVTSAYADHGHGNWHHFHPDADHGVFWPGNLLVSRTVYDAPAGLKAGETKLAPGCTIECTTASAGPSFPEVFDNSLTDENFGITSQIFLDQLTPWGWPINSVEVPNSGEHGYVKGADQMVTSFSSKSELALNLSTDGRYVSFAGYVAGPGEIDTSKGNTPGVIDPTNPDPVNAYRVIAQVGADGHFHFTETNAYSGDNPRAAIVNEEEGDDLIYAAGNAGNGKKPVAEGVITGGGAQIMTPSLLPETAQTPGAPTPVGSFNITQLGDKADKPSKDNNYRGLTIADKVLYYTKGSGGNGVDTVYFVDTTGKACPTGGVGLPQPGAKLPTSGITPIAEDLKAKKEELQPTNMCILKGLPDEIKSEAWHPFGLWFANPHTLYIADEGNGEAEYSKTTGLYTQAANEPHAGLEKWVFDTTTQEWKFAYALQAGLNLGQPYTIPGYPTGENPATKLPWSPATDGLRALTGRVNRDGTVTLYGITSTVSGNGDQGADPDKLVTITDPIGASTPASWERFQTLRTSGFGELFRGVSFTPGTDPDAGFGGPWGH